MGVYDEESFYTKIVGVSFIDESSGEERQKLIKKYMHPGTELIPYIEKENPATHEPALALWFKRRRRWYHLGYLYSRTGRDLISSMQSGLTVRITVKEITGGTKEKESRGVNLFVEKFDASSDKGKLQQFRLEDAWKQIEKKAAVKKITRRERMLISSGEMPEGYRVTGLITGYASDKSTPKAYRQAIKALDNAAGGVGADAVFSVGFNSNLAVAQGCFGKSAVLEVVAWGTAAEKIKTRTRLKTDEM